MFSEFNYIPPGKQAKNIAKASLGYIGNRPGKDLEEAARILFGNIGTLTKEQAEQLIDEAPKNTYFFRLIISPDPKSENKQKNLNLWQLTRQIVQYLEEKLEREIPLIAAEHKNTDIPHVHAMLLIERRGREMLITKETIAEVYELATQKALEQQQQRQRVKEQGRGFTMQRFTQEFERNAKPSFTITTCPGCKFTKEAKIISRKFLQCTTCERIFLRDQSLSQAIRKEAECGLSY